MSEFLPGTIQRELDDYVDQQRLTQFRSNPPAFLAVSAKRKTR